MDSHSELHRRRIDLVAFLGALCLFLSTVEYLFPKPIPFMRLGLANLPIIISLHLLPFPYLMLLTLVKVAGQGLVNGTLASYVFLFSAAGSITSVLAMYAVSRIPERYISLIGVSLTGALASNAMQVLLSLFFIFGQNALLIAPLFLGIGTVSGLLIGMIARAFVAKSRWYALVEGIYASH
jgi:uncharacterized membrane protein